MDNEDILIMLFLQALGMIFLIHLQGKRIDAILRMAENNSNTISKILYNLMTPGDRAKVDKEWGNPHDKK